MRQSPAQQPGSEHQRQADQQRTDEALIDQRHRCDIRLKLLERDDGGENLQHEAEGARHPAGLPCANPQRASPLQRPGGAGPLDLQRQRDRHGDKTHADRQQAFAEQTHALIAAAEGPGCHCQIDRAEHHRRPGAGIRLVVHQPGLQSEPSNRGAEQQGRIRKIAELAGGVVSIEQGRAEIDRDRHRQECFADPEMAVLVGAKAPQPGQQKRRRKAQQVERPPALFPGNSHDRSVEHGDVGEQSARRFSFSAQQERYGKAAKETGQRHGLRILQHRQCGTQGGKQDHEGKGHAGRHDLENPRRCKNGEIQHGDPRALQMQAEIGTFKPLPVPYRQQRRPGCTHRGQPRLDREQPRICHQPGQEGEADEQHHQTGPDDRVAAQQPADGLLREFFGQAGPAGIAA